MKYLFFLILFCATTNVDAQNATLIVEISGIKNDKGIIEIGLYNKASDFPIVGNQFKYIRTDAISPTTRVVFKNIPIGVYGISIYNDVNSDGACNLNWIGYPVEGFCFSNNFKPFLSAPKFKDVKFVVKGNKTIKIKMINE